jgi:hypothetical protein
VRGAYCANCGIPFLYQRISGRDDINVFDPVEAVGRLDIAMELNPKKNILTDLLDPAGAVALEPGQSWSFDFASGDLGSAGVRAIDLRTWQGSTGRVFRSGLPGVLLLPVMRTRPGARVSVVVDGELATAPLDPFDSWLRRTLRTPAGVSRRPVPLGGALELPQGVDTFRLDLTVPHLDQIVLRWIKVKILP